MHHYIHTVVWQAVVVNLCLEGKPAQLLGIENFVCEVQLVLDAFDLLLQVLASRVWHCSRITPYFFAVYT
jgi:hypothetical protein